MNFFKSLIAKSDDLGQQINDRTSGIASDIPEAIKSVMSIVMPIVLIVVLAFGMFFSIKLGIAYAKTETTEKREEAKKRLVGAVVGFGIGILAAVVFYILLGSNVIYALFGVDNPYANE